MAEDTRWDAFWPLPGGTLNYVDTLKRVLELVGVAPRTEGELEQWFQDRYAVKASSAHWYVRIALAHTGLFEKSGGVYRLSVAGEKFLNEPSKISFLFDTLDNNVRGFGETLDVLGEKPLGLDALATELARRINKDWKSHNQPAWRVQWLRSMGLVTLAGGMLTLTEPGRKIYQSHPRKSSAEARPAGRLSAVADVHAVAGENVERMPPSPGAELQFSHVVKELKAAQRDASHPKRLEVAVKNAFVFLGFEAKHIGGSGDTDVLVLAPLGRKKYSAVVDSKSSSKGKVPLDQIDFDSLDEHKKLHSASFIAVVGESFAGGNLTSRAEKKGVTLIQTQSLIDLMTRHEFTPLDLEDLKEIFTKFGVLNLVECTDLQLSEDSLQKTQDRLHKTFNSLYDLQRRDEPTTPSDVRWQLQKEFSLDDVVDTLRTLEVLGLVDKDLENHWHALLSPEMFRKRIRVLSEPIPPRTQETDSKDSES